jgi:serine/threonine-protein kinase
VTPELAAVVHRMLQKRPADRFANAEAVSEALAPFDADDVAPPDPAWLPELPARVALARGSSPGVPVQRQAGSTSQIVMAALRTGGTSSSPALSKEAGKPRGGSRPSPALPHDEQTTRASDDDTHPSERLAPQPAPAPAPAGPTALLIALSVALVLALLGIVILLLRK